MRPTKRYVLFDLGTGLYLRLVPLRGSQAVVTGATGRWTTTEQQELATVFGTYREASLAKREQDGEDVVIATIPKLNEEN